MTSGKNFKKQARERAKKTGESYQEAHRQLMAQAKRREADDNEVIVEQLRSDGVVMRIRVDRITLQTLSDSLLVSNEPCPANALPRMRLIMSEQLTGMPSNDPALTDGRWHRITPEELWDFLGPRHNPNDELSMFVEGRFVRTIRHRYLTPVRWTPRSRRNGHE